MDFGHIPAIWNREIKIYSGVEGIRRAWFELISKKSKVQVINIKNKKWENDFSPIDWIHSIFFPHFNLR